MRLLLCLVCVAAVVAQQQQTATFSGTTFQTISGGNGNGGGFKINTNGNWMSLQVDSLCEYDSNGNQLQCTDLTKHSFGWGTPVLVAAPQIDGNASLDHFQQLGCFVHLDNGAYFNITAMLVDTDAKSSDAKHGDVKWTYTIWNWPWISGSQNCNTEAGCPPGQLCLLAGLDGFGGIVNGGASHAKNGAGTAPLPYNFTVQGVTYQNGFLNQPSQATCDGKVINVACGHTLQGSGKPLAQWCFDKCTGTIVYDPVTGPCQGGCGTPNPGNSNKKTSPPAPVTSQTGLLQGLNDGSLGVSANGNWQGLQWATLTEYDSTGTAVQSVDLTKTHFGWSQPDIYTVQYTHPTTVDEKMPHVNFTSTLENNAIFSVNAYFFNVSSVVSSNKRNSVKFTIDIQNWPWTAGAAGYYTEQGFFTGSTLVLTAGLVGYGGIVRHYIHSGGANVGDLVQADFTFATLISPDCAFYDQSNTCGPVAINYTLSGKPEVMWTFNYFVQEVKYDPDLYATGTTSTASVDLTSPGFITLWAILGLMTIGGLVIGITFTLSRKQRRPSTTPNPSSASDVNL